MQYRATFARPLTSCLLIAGLSVWAAPSAHAQTPADAPVLRTAPLAEPTPAAPADDFQLGLDALTEARYADAVTAFKAAHARDQRPAALLNLGIAYTNLQRPHLAVQSLRAYLDAPDATRTADQVTAVEREIARLHAESGRIGLHLVPQHARVELDGEVVDVRAGELLAAPGKRTISASADGYRPYSQTLDVPAGKFTLEIELQRIDTSAQTVAKTAEATASAAPAPALHEPTDEPENGAQSACALSQVCLGPVVALLGPPNLIGGGLHARIGHYLGVGFDYQALPTLSLNPISFGTSLVSGNVRVYPFGGAFFLSGGVGYQSLRGQIRDGDISVGAKAGFPAAMASIGFMGHDGFVLGADLGLLFPLGSMRAHVQQNDALAQSAVPQADIDAARAKVESRVNQVLGALPLLLQVNLLRVGYLF
jgi:hypothetical protein